MFKPAPVETPPPLASQRGVSMPFDNAVRRIAFRPFVPSRQLVDVALIAPLTGDDVKANRGIAFEYASLGDALLLSEWPKPSRQLTAGAALDLGGAPCRPEKFKEDGVLWSTHRGVIMTLQPDGKIKPLRIMKEAQRLVRVGAC